MTNRIALSLALPDTNACLTTLDELAPRISLAEIRLDLMESYDLPRLIAESSCPLIITCRPPREGGRFVGSEAERLAVLAQAMALGAAYVDVEWDCVTALKHYRTRTRVIGSRHWFDAMPATLWNAYHELAPYVDAVKLVGTAACPADVLPIFDLLQHATLPTIGIAMGAQGQITRVLAPCFSSCLLTYGASSAATVTAPGQVSIQELTEAYHLDRVGPQTMIHLHLCENRRSAGAVLRHNRAATAGTILHVPWIVAVEAIMDVVPHLRAWMPRLTITADPALKQAWAALCHSHPAELGQLD
jgi:3-dehydroquinate dehydratase/shikimate dehydrogenase